MTYTRFSQLTRIWWPFCRVGAVAFVIAITLQFLPVERTLPTSLSSARVGNVLPIQLLSYARAATTTLELSKTGPATASPGGNIVYRLTVTNTTAVSAEQVVEVRDTYPDFTSYVSNAAPIGWFGGTLGNQARWFTNDFLPPNSTVNLTLTLKLDSPLPNGLVITNANYTAEASNAELITGTNIVTTIVQAPEFGSLNKTVFPLSVVPGEYLTYTLTLSNTGDATANNIVITDTIPAHTSYADSDPIALAPSSSAGSVITWTTILPLAVGEQGTFTMVVQTDPVITNGLEIVNPAYGATAMNVYTPAVGLDFAPATVSSQPALTITKSSQPFVSAGDLLTYLITVTNQFSATDFGRNLIVTDNMPPEAVFVDAGVVGGSATMPGVGDSGPVTLTITSPGQLNANQSAVLTLTVQVKSPLTNGIVITNTYSLSASNLLSPIIGQPVTTTVTSTPTLEIFKVGRPEPASAGDTITYTIVYTNSGNMNATNVTITDVFPANTTFNSDLGDFDFGTSTDLGGVGRSWDVALIPGAGGSGQITLTLNISSPLPNNTPLTNVVHIRADQPGGDTYTATNTVSTAPELEISKAANPSPVAAGATLTYTIHFTNSGNGPANDVHILDQLPSQVVYNGDQGGVVTWNLLSLAGGGSNGTIVLTVTVTAPLTNGIFITNSVVITSIEGVSHTATISTQVNSTANFTIHKTVNPAGIVSPGQLLTYTLAVTNQGNSFGVGTIISDAIPANTTFVAASPGYNLSLPAAGTPITWSTNIPGGSGQVFTFVVLIDSPLANGTDITNTAQVANSQSSSISNLVTNTVISTATLEIVKIASPSPVEAGQALTYTIYYSNTGQNIATGIQITDTLPLSVTYNGAISTPDIVAGNVLVWNSLPDLAPGEGVQIITVTVTVTQPIISGTNITNQVDIAGSNAALNSYVLTTPVHSRPVWQISKTANPSPVTVGSVLTYTITFTNVGNANASSVVISDIFDSNVSFLGASDGGLEIFPGVVSWTLASVAANGLSQSLQLTVTVAATLPNNTILTNNFAITSAQNRLATAGFITTVVQAPLLNVTKSVSPTNFARAGDPIEYTIIYSNTGSVAASLVTITDTFPLSITNIISSSASAVFQSGPAANVVVWSDAVLPPNGQGVINILATVITSPWGAAGGQMLNTVVVNGDGYTASNSVAVPGRSGLPTVITVTAVPTTTQVGNSIAITAEVRDAYDNPVFNGTPLTFTTSLAGTSLLPGTTTTANGQASGTLNSTTTGSTTVTAQVAGGSGPLTGTTVATFTSGPVASFVISATSPQTAGVSFPITITAYDASGNLATNFSGPVTLTDTTTTIIHTAGGPVTLINGITVTNVTVFSATSPAFDNILVISGALTASVEVEILADFSSLVLNLTADSPIRVCETGLLTATLQDGLGNPAANTSITFLYSSNFLPTSGSTLNTNANGVAPLLITRIADNIPQPDNIVAQLTSDSSITNNTTVASLPLLPSAVGITVSVSPPSIPANGTAMALVSAQVATCAGPVADGTVVTFTVSPALGLTPGSPFTATTSSGLAIRTITAGTVTGTATITGTALGASDNSTLLLTNPDVPLLTISKDANPAPGLVGPGDTIYYTVIVTNIGALTASSVIITDDLPLAVGFVPASGTTNGDSLNETLGQVTVTTATLGIGQQLTATWQVTVTANISGTTIENWADVTSQPTGAVTTSDIVSHLVITQPATAARIFLPIILKGCCLADLVIDQLTVNTGSNPPLVTVVVKNVGQASTGTGFWVDLYVNPSTEPADLSGGDRRWQRVKTIDRGIAWPVDTPLGPGDMVTLVSSSGTDLAQTKWTIPLPSGQQYNFYAFADSFDQDNNPWVEIFESNEDHDNQFGPQIVNLSLSLAVESDEPASAQEAPPRRDLGR